MTLALFLIIALAVSVEAVEALTIVLAAGVAHNWRAALTGAGSAFAIIVCATALLYPVITLIPLTPMHLIVGGVMLYYGVTWLRKGVLRASGRKAKHDEDAIYKTTLKAKRSGFALAFNGVFMEGMEIVLVVVALSAHSPLGFAAAGAAVAIVVAAGFFVRHPLSRVPENAMKLFVGVMLSGIGVFWFGEGVGIAWPDVTLFAIYAALAVGTVVAVRLLTVHPHVECVPFEPSEHAWVEGSQLHSAREWS